MGNRPVQKFTIAMGRVACFIPAQASTVNVSYTPTKRSRAFTFAIPTLWGSFILVCSQYRVRLTFEESDI